jgi:amino acid adenylation domain-containing protein
MLNTTLDYLINSYEKYPEKVAIVYKERKITYKELYISAIKIAGWINSNIKCSRKPIIVMMKNSDIAIESFMGIAFSGNIYVPLAYDLPEERIKTIIEILNPACVINCEDDRISSLVKCPTVSFEEAANYDCMENEVLNKAAKIIDTDPVYIIFTSGSTGIPKGTVVCHKSVTSYVQSVIMTFGFDDKVIFGNQTPFYFSMSVLDIYTTIFVGGTLVVIPKVLFSFPVRLIEYMNECKVNAIYWVPTAMGIMADRNVFKAVLPKYLTKILFAGEVMPTVKLNYWINYLKDAMYANLYGPTEITDTGTYYIVNRKLEDNENVPIGKPFTNCSVMLLKEDSSLVDNSSEEKGEICIRGSFLAQGYYNNWQKTNEHFIQNPTHSLFPETVYRTGDLAHYDKEGNIIYDGRMDYQIKHMGYRIELGEIESNVGSIENIEQTACIYLEKRDIMI